VALSLAGMDSAGLPVTLKGIAWMCTGPGMSEGKAEKGGAGLRAQAVSSNLAAAAAPGPEEEPPVTWSRFHGLRAGGNGRSRLGPPSANSYGASLSSSTPPPAVIVRATALSNSRTLSIRSFEWQVVRMPAVS